VLGDGGAGRYLGAIGQDYPGLILAVGTALAQQNPSLRSMSLMTSLAVISIV
jgi:predicted amino acid-binding ACT domain protein